MTFGPVEGVDMDEVEANLDALAELGAARAAARELVTS